MHLAALLRVGSELVTAGTTTAVALLIASALAFAGGVAGWLLRYGPVYLRPRSDGQPG